MIFRISLLWIAGLLTLVPYGIFQLLFHAQRDEYALLISLVLFWVFGFWAIMGPLLSAYKIHQLFKLLESAQFRKQVIEIITHQDSQDAAIKIIAMQNHIPRFLAKKLYLRVQQTLLDANQRE